MLRFGKSEIPALADHDGALTVDLGALDLTRPLPANLGKVSLHVDEGLSEGLTLGNGASVDLGLRASTYGELVFVTADSPVSAREDLADFGLQSWFDVDAHSADVLAVVRLGASVSGGVDVRAPLNPVLKVGATLEAGVDGSFGLVRAFDAATPAGTVLGELLRSVRLPSMLIAAPAADEVLYLALGGKLSLGASLSVGYEMGGTRSLELGELELTESCSLGLLGTVGVTAEVAGSFRVEVRAGTTPGWVRVTVRKSGDRRFGIAADVGLGATNTVKSLPETPNELLEALLGLKGKSWLHLFGKLESFTDLGKAERYLDALAVRFVEAFTGEAFTTLTLGGSWREVQEAARRSNSLDPVAVELCQRYWDRAAATLNPEIEGLLRWIVGLASIHELTGRVLEGRLGQVLYLLTAGDTLGALGRPGALAEVQRRAQATLDLAGSEDLGVVRKVIALATDRFALDHLVRQLAVTEADDLREPANRVLAGFVERVAGESLDGLSKPALRKRVDEVRAALGQADDFASTLYAGLTEVVNGSVGLALHAGYDHSDASEALVDVELDLGTPLGRELVCAAGMGRFDKVLGAVDPSVVRVRSGTLTNRFGRSTRVGIDVVGWKKQGWHYQSMRELLVESKQRLQPSGNGGLTVVTELEMGTTQQRRTLRERRFCHFALALIGASKGVVEFDAATRRYLVDGVQSMSARYEKVFEDERTTPSELARYLSFAVDLGLATSHDDAWTKLATTLPTTPDGGYGKTRLSYDVRLMEEGLQRLVLGSLDERSLRRRIQLLVLVNHLGRGADAHVQVGWAYWTPRMRAVAESAGFVSDTRTVFELGPVTSPLLDVTAPSEVHLQPNTDKQRLATLYQVEDAVVGAFLDLHATLNAGKRLTLREYEKALRSFGRALWWYDRFDAGDNSVFALLDAWIGASGGTSVRNASLTLTCEASGVKVEKLLFA